MLHTLVLVTELLKSSQAELTVEEGDSQVEEHATAIHDLRTQLVEHEKAMSDRLRRIEELLENSSARKLSALPLPLSFILLVLLFALWLWHR